jgi:glycosyltransferase involved in cell wall biosynthesis
VLLNAKLRRELPSFPNIAFIEQESSSGAVSRFWLEQRVVRHFLRASGADVLLSAGNFALWNSPVPQILLSRNSLYTSRDFFNDLRFRGESRLWIDTQLKGAVAKWSIAAADLTVAPSAAFADELRRWTGKAIAALHHGFDREAFVLEQSPLPAPIQDQLNSSPDALRLLFVSHYNYYRNFETLLRALPLIRQKIRPRKVRLILTSNLAAGANPGSYRPDSAAALVRELGLGEEVVELGSIPYQLLHHVYKAAEIYVTPAYAESFAHPLVEAMSSGLPVVASDLAVHQEICGPAALYFRRFSSRELAQRILKVAGSCHLAAQLARAGEERSRDFSWRQHVERILGLSRGLL